MQPKLQFDFRVDKTEKTILVIREFAAPRPLVWKAWTTPELLDQWWAPHPWKAETVSMDFRDGGHWLYAMIGPEGERHYSKATYKKIVTETSVLGGDGFSDAEGNIDPEMPLSNWEQRFGDRDGNTVVTITERFDELSDLEEILKMGFQEGFTAGLENLDKLLEQIA